MAYVKFFRGPESRLPVAGASGLVEGSFYLTEDTWRLYNVINENGVLTPRPLGEKINIIASAAQIEGAADHIGEFAYITSGNVFAVSIPDGTGAKWVQINTPADDTHLSALTFDSNVANDVATISIGGTNASGDNPTGDSFKITAGSGIDITATSGQTKDITISKTATPLTLTGTTDATLTVEGNDGVQIVAGENITLATDTNNKTITITGDAGGVGDVNITPIENSGNGFNVEVIGANGDGASDTLDPTVTLGTNNTAYHFVNGNMNLPVYTKQEIDNSLTGLNAMVYKGTIGTGGTTVTVPTASATTGPQIGDTYKVVSPVTVPVEGGSTAEAQAGDLIIARGTEGTSGKIESNLVWDIIAAGDDVDSTYELVPSSNGFALEELGTDEKGAVDFANSDKITTVLTVPDAQAAPNEMLVTVSHNLQAQDADATGTAVTQAAGETKTFTALTGITLDTAPTSGTYGHVKGKTFTTLTVTDTTLDAANDALSTTVSMSSGTVTVADAVSVSDTDNNEVSGNSSFTMTSAGGTVNMTVASNNINYDIVWGTF